MDSPSAQLACVVTDLSRRRFRFVTPERTRRRFRALTADAVHGDALEALVLWVPDAKPDLRESARAIAPFDDQPTRRPATHVGTGVRHRARAGWRWHEPCLHCHRAVARPPGCCKGAAR